MQRRLIILTLRLAALALASQLTSSNAPTCPVVVPLWARSTSPLAQCSLQEEAQSRHSRGDTHHTHADDIPPPKFLSFAEWRSKSDEEARRASDPSKGSLGDATGMISALVQDVVGSSATNGSEIALKIIIEGDAAPFDANGSSIPASSTKVVTAIEMPILQPNPAAGSGGPNDPLTILKSRTNYASFDCAATIHRVSSGTRSPSAILSDKKDRYMLTPCNVKEKFVVFELCDEIELDTVVLANLEFFSSMFKFFRVRVSNGLEGKDVQWSEAGTFRARNTRGLQVFPVKNVSGFYRYVRIDFLTHYGNEYYCPVSLVRVYGLTQIDAYRRDEERDRLKHAEVEPNESPSSAIAEEEKVQQTNSSGSSDATTNEIDGHDQTVTVERVVITKPQARPATTVVRSVPDEEDAVTRESVIGLHTTSDSVPADNQSRKSTDATSISPATNSPDSSHTATPSSSRSIYSQKSSSSSTDSVQNAAPSLSSNNPADESGKPLSHQIPGSQTQVVIDQAPTPMTGASNETPPIQTITTTKPAVHANTAPNQGESIFGTIMKRLSALEENHNLSVKYVEEQSREVYAALKRVDAKLHKFESWTKQHEAYMRVTMREFDIKLESVTADNKALTDEVRALGSALVVGKGLVFAQLVALFIILIFIALTRGAPTIPPNLSVAPLHTTRHGASHRVGTYLSERRSGASSPTAGTFGSKTDRLFVLGRPPTQKRNGQGRVSKPNSGPPKVGKGINHRSQTPPPRTLDIGKLPFATPHRASSISRRKSPAPPHFLSKLGSDWNLPSDLHVNHLSNAVETIPTIPAMLTLKRKESSMSQQDWTTDSAYSPNGESDIGDDDAGGLFGRRSQSMTSVLSETGHDNVQVSQKLGRQHSKADVLHNTSAMSSVQTLPLKSEERSLSDPAIDGTRVSTPKICEFEDWVRTMEDEPNSKPIQPSRTRSPTLQPLLPSPSISTRRTTSQGLLDRRQSVDKKIGTIPNAILTESTTIIQRYNNNLVVDDDDSEEDVDGELTASAVTINGKNSWKPDRVTLTT